MKQQDKYTKICQELNKRAKANIKRFVSWIDEGAFKEAGIDITELVNALETVADKLTNPEKGEALFKAEDIKPCSLLFVPFFLTDQDGAEMIRAYGQDRTTSKGKEGGGA